MILMCRQEKFDHLHSIQAVPLIAVFDSYLEIYQ